MATMEEIINKRIESLEGFFNYDLYVRTRDLVLINYESKSPERKMYLDKLNDIRKKLYEDRWDGNRR